MIMKFAKLLCAGNSFFGGGREVAYRLNKWSLPKFNEGKNPFTEKRAGEPAAAKPENQIIAAPKISDSRAIVAAAIPRAPKAPAPAPVPAKPSKESWTAKLNPFRPSAPAAPPAAVQPELSLSLDSVKVVHNDLADADVEIVPVKSHAQPEAPMLPPARRAWEYLGESVLRS
jgi:hypothetical protein